MDQNLQKWDVPFQGIVLLCVENFVWQIMQNKHFGVCLVKVKFKYFQNLTGILELPAEFKPLEIKVDLAGNKKKALIDDRWYPWLQVTAKTS